MTVTLKEGDLDLVTKETQEARQVEFRDPEGHLVMFVRIMRDGRTMLTCVKGEDDFEFNATEHKIALFVQPDSQTGIVLG